MIIYYSGLGSPPRSPEQVLRGGDNNIMLNYYNHTKKNRPDKRFKQIIRARKNRGKK